MNGGDEGALHTYSCLLLELIDNLLKSKYNKVIRPCRLDIVSEYYGD